MRDSRIQELLEAAREIEESLVDDGYSPEEMLFIATVLSQSASRLMSGEDEYVDEDDEEDSGDESPAEEPGGEESEDDMNYT